MFRHGPGQGQAVKGGGAPADLVQDHQAPGGGLVEDAGGFVHLHQKSALAPADVIHRPHPGEDAVGEPDHRLGGRDETAQVGQERDQRHLAQDGGLAAHVGPGDDEHLGVGVQGDIVGHEAAGGQDPFDDRVPALLDQERGLGHHPGPVILMQGGQFGQGGARRPESPGPGPPA